MIDTHVHFFSPPWESQRPYKAKVVRPHPFAPAGLAGKPHWAAWSSSAGAEMTGRERAPVWPMIHQHRLEAPPQMAGSMKVWPADPGGHESDLQRRQNLSCDGSVASHPVPVHVSGDVGARRVKENALIKIRKQSSLQRKLPWITVTWMTEAHCLLVLSSDLNTLVILELHPV